MRENLFFIAIIPNQEICSEVLTFKEYASNHFQSNRALNSPAHITLIPPFKWISSQINEVQEVLKTFASQQPSFYIELSGFDCFEPRVIFVDIEESQDLKHLQKQLELKLEEKVGIKNEGRFGFHPHMTVAFKDLKRSVFPEAWAHFSKLKYERMFNVQSIYLLRHQNKRWEVFREFQF